MKSSVNTIRSVKQASTGLLAGVVLLMNVSGALAQLPELTYPSTLSGAETSAKFFAGATADNGVTYASSFTED
jgi:hypothetical protein